MNPIFVLRPSLLSKYILPALALVSLASCKGLRFSEEESYGLKLVTLNISAEEYGLLKGQLLSKRPANVEIKVAGEFSVHCRASFAGRSSLDSYRKSYDLDFCNEKYKKRSSYRLSAQAIDKTMVRSLMGFEVFKKMGLEVPNGELASAYINRKYQGVYLFTETIDNEFYKAHKIRANEIYQAQFGNASFRTEWASRMSEAFDYDGKGEDNYVYLQEIYRILYDEPQAEVFARKLEAFFDVESFLTYMAVAVTLNHWDGFDNNYYLAMHEDSKKLITTPWDLDRIWEKPIEFQPDDLIVRNMLLDRLLKMDVYKQRFVRKVADTNAAFPAEKLIEMMRGYEEQARRAYSEDPILSRYQGTAYVELEQNILAWDVKVKDFLARNPPN